MGDFFKKNPIRGILILLIFINWFLCAGISTYLGGDAIGTLPSKDGFILTSHGRHETVSESAWIFSLYYSGGTLLLTPAIFLFALAGELWNLAKKSKWYMILFAGIFLTLWFQGWFMGIGHGFLRSLEDWEKLKHSPITEKPAQARTNTEVTVKP